MDIVTVVALKRRINVQRGGKETMNKNELRRRDGGQRDKGEKEKKDADDGMTMQHEQEDWQCNGPGVQHDDDDLRVAWCVVRMGETGGGVENITMSTGPRLGERCVDRSSEAG